MYNTCMDDRDSNWGSHGNPNREEWYRYRHGLSSDFDVKPKKLTVNLETIFWIVAAFLVITAFVPSLRDYVYSGIDFTQEWYDAVDSFLDALHVPKLPH
jgi:hypothetical protein